MLYQQGDVLLTTVKRLPGKGKKVKSYNGRLILADGEATGHAHAVAVAEGVEMREISGNLYLCCDKAATITHEEHGAITVPPGKYRVDRVQEYDHFAEEARDVQD